MSENQQPSLFRQLAIATGFAEDPTKAASATEAEVAGTVQIQKPQVEARGAVQEALVAMGFEPDSLDAFLVATGFKAETQKNLALKLNTLGQRTYWPSIFLMHSDGTGMHLPGHINLEYKKATVDDSDTPEDKEHCVERVEKSNAISVKVAGEGMDGFKAIRQANGLSFAQDTGHLQAFALAEGHHMPGSAAHLLARFIAKRGLAKLLKTELDEASRKQLIEILAAEARSTLTKENIAEICDQEDLPLNKQELRFIPDVALGYANLLLANLENDALHTLRNGNVDFCIINKDKVKRMTSVNPKRVISLSPDAKSPEIEIEKHTLEEGDVVIAFTESVQLRTAAKTTLSELNDGKAFGVAEIAQEMLTEGKTLAEIVESLKGNHIWKEGMAITAFRYIPDTIKRKSKRTKPRPAHLNPV